MSVNNKNKKESGKKTFTRLLALILVALMVLGAVGMTISFLFANVGAYEIPDYDNSRLVSVGLMYGSGVTVGFETTSEYGFDYGIVTSDRTFTKVFSTDKTLVSVACDANIINNSRNLSVTDSEYADIGGYHIQTLTGLDSIDNDLAYYRGLFPGYDVFPAYVDGYFYIRIGQFTSYTAAEDFLNLNTVPSLYSVEIAYPSEQGVSLIDPLNNQIVYEVSGTDVYLGLQAIQNEFDGDTEYIVTPAKNPYMGTFAYQRYRTSTIDGVTVLNILDLENYIEGVMPSEIHNTWPIESLRTFAITVRTYTLETMEVSKKHESLNFDICNSSCCQVFRGRTNVNDAIMQAVNDTRGIYLTYKGNIAKIAYSSCMGGVTVSPNDAWGSVGDYPYLNAKATPWEKYENYNNGSWTTEAAPDEIYTYLYNKGYTLLRGSISDMRIAEYAENSSYIKNLAITDIFGTTINIKYSDKIRIALSKFVKSANFVVGLGGSDVEQLVYTLSEYEEPESGINIISSDGENKGISLDSLCVLTSDGAEMLYEPQSLGILTSDGACEYVASEDGSSVGMDIEGLSGVSVSDSNMISLPGSSQNFVFVGKGWGHGVGISQYGIKELADMGYTYDEILSVYMPGTDFTNLYEYNF